MTIKRGTLKKIIFGIIGTIILFILVTIVSIIIVFKNAPIISKGQPIENYSEHNSALLVVDIQEIITGDVSIFPWFEETQRS